MFYKDIPGWPMYQAGDDGTIRSFRRGAPRVLRPGAQTPGGHQTVALGRGNSQSVHYLVALAFHGPRPEGCEVLHLDHNPQNNAAANLRWGTRSENLKQDYDRGRRDAQKRHAATMVRARYQ